MYLVKIFFGKYYSLYNQKGNKLQIYNALSRIDKILNKILFVELCLHKKKITIYKVTKTYNNNQVLYEDRFINYN